jgi:hypothetical protein
LLEKPFSLEGLPGNPVKQVSVYLGSNRLHEVTGQTVAGRSIDVQNAQPRIKTQRGSREPSFRLKD